MATQNPLTQKLLSWTAQSPPEFSDNEHELFANVEKLPDNVIDMINEMTKLDMEAMTADQKGPNNERDMRAMFRTLFVNYKTPDPKATGLGIFTFLRSDSLEVEILRMIMLQVLIRMMANMIQMAIFFSWPVGRQVEYKIEFARFGTVSFQKYGIFSMHPNWFRLQEPAFFEDQVKRGIQVAIEFFKQDTSVDSVPKLNIKIRNTMHHDLYEFFRYIMWREERLENDPQWRDKPISSYKFSFYMKHTYGMDIRHNNITEIDVDDAYPMPRPEDIRLLRDSLQSRVKLESFVSIFFDWLRSIHRPDRGAKEFLNKCKENMLLYIKKVMYKELSRWPA